MSRILRAAVALTMACSGGMASARADFPNMVRSVPSSANALVLIDVQQLVNSPLGKREGWAKRIAASYESGMTIVPPGAERAVLAVHLDPEMLLPLWETAVMDLAKDPDMAEVAKARGSEVDLIDKYESLPLAGNAVIVRFAPFMVAAMAPANRQAVARWVKDSDAQSEPSLSPYLMEAYGYAKDLGTPIIVAMDLEDVPNVDRVRQGLEEANYLFEGQKVDKAALAEAIASIRGVTLGVSSRTRCPAS